MQILNLEKSSQWKMNFSQMLVRDLSQGKCRISLMMCLFGRCAFYHLQIATPLIRAFVNQNSLSCGCYFYGPISFFFFFFLFFFFLRYNWHITSCKFKVYNGLIWDMYICCKMIIMIRLVYTSFTWRNYNFFMQWESLRFTPMTTLKHIIQYW